VDLHTVAAYQVLRRRPNLAAVEGLLIAMGCTWERAWTSRGRSSARLALLATNEPPPASPPPGPEDALAAAPPPRGSRQPGRARRLKGPRSHVPVVKS